MTERITVTYEIPAPPEGWEYAGVREVRKGELYFNGKDWVLWDCDLYVDAATPVAVRKQQWRPATEADIGREDARFSDCGYEWGKGQLIHVINGGVPFPYVAILEMMPSDPSVFSRCEVPVT